MSNSKKNHLNKTINYLCKQIFLSIVITGRFQSAKLINTFRNIVFHYLKRCYFSCLFVLRNYNKSRVYLVEQFLKDMPDQCFHLEVSSYFREENATTYQSHWKLVNNLIEKKNDKRWQYRKIRRDILWMISMY